MVITALMDACFWDTNESAVRERSVVAAVEADDTQQRIRRGAKEDVCFHGNASV